MTRPRAAALLGALALSAGLACTAGTGDERVSEDDAGGAWSHLVGIRHRLGPPECEKIAGWLLEPGGASEYGIAHVSCEGNELFLLDSLTHRDDAGRAHWQVLAVTEVPERGEDEFLLAAVCSVDDRLDRNVFAVVSEREDGPGVSVRRAWRVEPVRRRFVEISTRGVTCEEPIRE